MIKTARRDVGEIRFCQPKRNLCQDCHAEDSYLAISISCGPLSQRDQVAGGGARVAFFPSYTTNAVSVGTLKCKAYRTVLCSSDGRAITQSRGRAESKKSARRTVAPHCERTLNWQCSYLNNLQQTISQGERTGPLTQVFADAQVLCFVDQTLGLRIHALEHILACVDIPAGPPSASPPLAVCSVALFLQLFFFLANGRVDKPLCT